MRADETIGVAAAARLLRSLGEAQEATVAERAKALGLRRTTAFVVGAGLEAMGLAERDGRGRLRAGPAATRLGLAYYGFGAMADAAEALLPVLRDDTDTCVSIIVSKGDKRVRGSSAARSLGS
jgi:DNA-binding IclR family transcriptional regulator